MKAAKQVTRQWHRILDAGKRPLRFPDYSADVRYASQAEAIELLRNEKARGVKLS